ncbi:hypothetical protein CANARDRAFT_176937 [[Candida] arabinofermentans NRRL YB-2248]|uniref:Uncharacterized protein n=1 Tax=[Candida] arabinofermentans NRRL YB-2248 TaxID=983967 RepID=A0A1E4SY10_9ASCO|nr:hypothetical protein CANARDRAFT_176937 [[Candida] arabinofermentans NRRL YB-2248]
MLLSRLPNGLARQNTIKAFPCPSKKKPAQRPSITKIGVPFEPFIPLRASRMPSPVTAPKLFVYNVFKHAYLIFFNIIQKWQFRSGMKDALGKSYKPKYTQWLNESIETFTKVNTAFAAKRVDDVRDNMSEFVYRALSKRQSQLPRKLTLGWELVKFNGTPKMVTFHAFPHDDGSTLMLQVCYKFQTTQKLTFKSIGEKKPREDIKELTEYIAFNIDPYTDKVVIAGSVFESVPEKKLRASSMPSQEETINYMISNADIYRVEPKELLELESSKSN